MSNIDLLAKLTKHGNTPIAKVKQHGEQVRQLRDGGGVKARDTGEVLTFPDSQTRVRMGIMYDLDHPDEAVRRKGIQRFRKSVHFKLFSPVRNKYA